MSDFCTLLPTRIRFSTRIGVSDKIFTFICDGFIVKQVVKFSCKRFKLCFSVYFKFCFIQISTDSLLQQFPLSLFCRFNNQISFNFINAATCFTNLLNDEYWFHFIKLTFIYSWCFVILFRHDDSMLSNSCDKL